MIREERAFLRGVGYAVATISRISGDTVHPAEVMATAVRSVDEFKRAGLDGYDLRQLRRIARMNPRYFAEARRE